MPKLSAATLERNRAEFEQYLAERLKRLSPVATTYTPSGQIIDWVRRDTQLGGDPIAIPPPPPVLTRDQRARQVTPDILLPGVAHGPADTVPFRRPAISRMSHTLSLAERSHLKIPPPPPGSGSHTIRAADGNIIGPAIDYTGHYYGNSGQSITNYGGIGTLSCFSPAVALSSHFSLIQIGCSNSQLGSFQNTVEAGWIVSPDQYGGDYKPHLFTYFTTDAYASEGDNIGGWDALQKGWVQSDANYYPGMTFSPLSQVDGPQQEITIQYQLRDGNWWFAAQGVWLGYYPASLFAVSPGPGQPVSTVNTLGDHADGVGFWGEVFDNTFTPPATQMGSGEFANDGLGWSAYMHNLQTQTDTSGGMTAYDGGAGAPTDASLYTIITDPTDTGSWGSDIWVGGPGGGHGSLLGPIASHSQLGLNQTDVFNINSRGGLEVSQVVGGGNWGGPEPIGSDNTFASTAGLAVTPQFGVDNQLDVLSVDLAGVLTVCSVTGGSTWNGPSQFGPAVFPPGAPLAASQQMGINQSDVFCINNDGALTVSCAFGNGGWNYAGPIGANGIFYQGAHLAACAWFGVPNRTAVFAVDTQGALRVAWVDSAGSWNGPTPITGNGVFPAGAPLAASQQIGKDQIDVFCIDYSGALVVVCSYEGGGWSSPFPVTQASTFNTFSPIAASQQVGLTQTDVFCIDRNGTLTVCSILDGSNWQGPLPISPQQFCVPATAVSVWQQVGLNQTDVFCFDKNGDLNVFSAFEGGVWNGPFYT